MNCDKDDTQPMLYRCDACGIFFFTDEVMEVRQLVNGNILFFYLCKNCYAKEHDFFPKEGK